MTDMSGFLWGAATSPHQTEGNNVNSDWWHREQNSAGEDVRSGDAVDSYHRYRDDMSLLASAGLNSYRFGVEWARIEPAEGEFSQPALDHYRRMIDFALSSELTPVVTLHHFTSPQWFTTSGGWLDGRAVDRFRSYVDRVASILLDVPWVCTINEPNILSLLTGGWADDLGGAVTAGMLSVPDERHGEVLIRAHQAASEILRSRTAAKVGWTVAQQSFTPTPGNDDVFRRTRWLWEDLYLQGAIGDDFIGSQSYTSQPVDANGPVPHPDAPGNTLMGWAYRPDALELSVRHAAAVTGLPVIVTENGIATHDDERRIEYTGEALRGMFSAMADGVDVRGYLHWSALDNYEWGSWKPTFGLIGVDRATFRREPKPSLAWLGGIARTNGAALRMPDAVDLRAL